MYSIRVPAAARRRHSAQFTMHRLKCSQFSPVITLSTVHLSTDRALLTTVLDKKINNHLIEA